MFVKDIEVERDAIFNDQNNYPFPSKCDKNLLHLFSRFCFIKECSRGFHKSKAFFTKLQLLSIVAESVTWKRENKNGNKFAATNNIEFRNFIEDCLHGSLITSIMVMVSVSWISTNLSTRQIAVEDAPRKRLMDLRLLHGVAYGHSWFGRWGYKICRGSFGVTAQNYYEPMETLGSLVLDDIVRDLSKTKYHKDIKQMICFYRDMSETQIVTIRELLRFMLNILLE
ncbi:RING/FYVE/PHD zinc finger superfamily protein [Trifolium repens]|nr:RING/FYVE/PHD zinc finger superfamily protein [Trifolium repens]